ncbi:DEAD/DEAH box helicase [Actinospica durhamensis]|uniref:DEAD/DEAH box helicase n=1 Tax=Actinospica durhamensis TaxID=1508375 RepID=UPI0027DB941A|nr:DEAD/DEAH box helicase [Actinospica durhamensis]
MATLDGLGIRSPFPIQSATIPVALTGADIIGQAKTGTGKTLAFGIPVLQRIEPSEPTEAAEPVAQAPDAAKSAGSSRRRGRSGGSGGAAKLPPAGGAPQALVVVPTRELAVQVCNDLAEAGVAKGVRVHALYGGRAYEPQVKALTEGVDIAVATPGRLLDLVNQGHLNLGRVRTLVLDEADEMLDLGFLPDVERIIKQVPAKRQTLLFSATMPGAVISLARQYMTKPTHIRAADPLDQGISVANIKQFVYRAHDLDKIEMLARILQADGRGLTMVFARTKRAVARITEDLQDRHFAVGAVHGDLAQGAREQALRAFRNGKVDVLVATDVAARGIDVEGVTHVVNYQCPEDEKVYTHRIGRTGRAGRTGTSVTLVDWEDMPRWGLINKALGLDYAEPVELYSTSPQLFADLSIPASAKGALPKQDRVRAGLDAEELEDLGGPGRRGQAAKPAAEPEPRLARAPRQRKRTRGGQHGTDEQAAVLGAAPVTQTQAAEAPAAQVAETGAEKPARKRTRKRATAEPVAEQIPVEVPVAQVVEAPAVQIAETATEKPARKRTRKRATTEPVAEETSVEVPVAQVVEAPAAQVAETTTDKPARKRTRKRATAEPVTEQAPAAQAPAAVEETVAEAPKQRRARAAAPSRGSAPARGAATGRGGAIKLAPGSLADPVAPAAQPAPAEAALTAAAEPAQAVFTQEPILPQRAESGRAPRKRGGSGKKAVSASTSATKGTVTSALPAKDAGEETILDALNVGPVANRRRTQI